MDIVSNEPEIPLPSKGTDLDRDIRDHAYLLLNGTVISIDPSVGSSSSLPAYAVWVKGELQYSATVDTEVGTSLHNRLQNLSRHFRNIYKQWLPDLVVIEDIPPQRYGGGNAEAHASLLKATGVLMALSGPRGYVRMKPIVWKRMVRSTYRKGDIEDAKEIGFIAIRLAKYYTENDLLSSLSKKKKKKSPKV